MPIDDMLNNVRLPRNLDRELSEALDEQLMLRNAAWLVGTVNDNQEYLHEKSDNDQALHNATESLSQCKVDDFCKAFNVVKNHVAQLQDNLDEAESKRNLHRDHIRKALKHLTQLDFDNETMNMLTDLLNQNQSRYVNELGIDDIKCDLEKWTKLMGIGGPVLKIIKDDIVSNVILPPDTDVACMCPICYVVPVNTALAPCGHTFCEKCARTATHTCFVCSHSILHKWRIYL
jgi:hypothetical protein